MSGTLLLRAAKKFKSELESAFEGSGLSACQFYVLRTVFEEGAMTQGTLSAQTGTDRSALVSIIDELERNGWVTRNAVPDDRRANLIELTDAGRETVVSALSHFQSFHEKFLSRFSKTEIHTLYQLLRRIV